MSDENEFHLSNAGCDDVTLIVDEGNIADHIDELYAEKLLRELRTQLGWELKSGAAYDHIRKFSRLYSNENRDIIEVAAIYRLAFRPGQGAP